MHHSHFGEPGQQNEKISVLQSQIVMMIRREAQATNENSARTNELQYRKRRHEHLVANLHKVDNFEEVELQVAANETRLDKHGKSINLQAQTIDLVIEKLEGMKLSHEKRVDRTEEQHSIILAEIQKANEAFLDKPPSDSFPPLANSQPAPQT